MHELFHRIQSESALQDDAVFNVVGEVLLAIRLQHTRPVDVPDPEELEEMEESERERLEQMLEVRS